MKNFMVFVTMMTFVCVTIQAAAGAQAGRFQQAKANAVAFTPAANFGLEMQGQYNPSKGNAVIFKKPSPGQKNLPKRFNSVQSLSAQANAPASPAVLIGSYTPANGSAMNLYGTPVTYQKK